MPKNAYSTLFIEDMINLTDVFILFLLLLGVYWVYQGMLLREFALKTVGNHCMQLDLQLLDQNVALRGFWFKRDASKQWHFWVSYTFEFSSTGEERYSGRIVLLGGKVMNIDLPPYRMP